MLFLLTASLGFSANYKVEVKPNVKIQQSEIEKNNIEIEKAFSEYKKADVSTALKEVDKQINEQKNTVEAMFFGEITKIEYVSSSKANLIISLKSPVLSNSNFGLDEKDQEKMRKLFKERTGKSMEYLANIPKKEFQEKWLPKLIDIVSERVLEKINNAKKFEEQEDNIRAEKINGKWNFFTEEELKNE